VEDVKTMRHKNWMTGLLAVVTLVGGILIHRTLKEDRINREVLRKGTVCPSLLSIARSPRDTLIVMKNEPLCTVFVLDSLQ
jgi:hypothetical protein